MTARQSAAAIMAATLLLGAGDIHGQTPSGALGNIAVNSEAPIHIEADVLEIDEPQNIATFIGQVRAQQDDMRLTTDELRISYTAAGDGARTRLRTVDALGNVVVTIDDQIAKGERALYDLMSQTVTLSGDVVLSQGPNVLRGEKLVFDLNTGKGNMVSSPAAQGGARVRMVITPNRN